ncbi:hypothetical protein [Bradyrhizobium sp. BR 1432]|uniref:hypothetical protein n=1 Tax=Bradyrhizobium sp. BR 1432 TaxID=3447966 RepID=UPI003EE4B63D
MAKKSRPRVNQLVDRLESGKLSMRNFVRQVTRAGVPKTGIGGMIGKPEAAPSLTKDLVRTGVLVKIEEIKKSGETLVHGTIKPAAVAFTQTIRSGPWTLESKAAALEVSRRGATESVPRDSIIEVKKRQPIVLKNAGARPVRFVAHQPLWEPNEFVYQYKGQKISGAEMWFELKTSDTDKKARPMYNVISSGGKGNFVLATVEPGTETLRCYYTDSDYIVTGLTGTGTITIEAKRAKRTEAIGRGKNIRIAKKEIFSIGNDGSAPLVIEIRSVSTRYWTPDSSYFDVGKSKFASGSEIYFEFVIPT